MSFVFERDECVLQQLDSVFVHGGVELQSVKVILTNKKIVFFEKARKQGAEDKEVARLLLNDIRVVQGIPQVVIIEDTSKLVLYFEDKNVTIDFNCFRSAKNMELCKQWKRLIFKTLAGEELLSVIASMESQITDSTNSSSNNESKKFGLKDMVQGILQQPVAKDEKAPVSQQLPQEVQQFIPQQVNSVPPESETMNLNTSIPRLFCSRCGLKIEGNAIFCKKCGAKL